MISVLFFFLAGALRGLAELIGYEHADSIFSAKVKPTSFFGSQMWKRKYRMTSYGTLYPHPQLSVRIPRIYRWYYKVFRIKYEERFLFSATALVWLTDAMHLTNFLMKFSLIAACLTADWNGNLWLVSGAYILAWTGGFNITYSLIFSKRLR